MASERLVGQILSDYNTLEPGQSDSWNPVGSKYELGYRLNLFYALARSLQFIEPPLRDLRVLDLGCGNGRSARMYLDMGLRPEQISGLDLRPGAVELARKLNPAIQWALYDGGALPLGHNWVSTTTVFSSVEAHESRQEIAGRIRDGLPSGGYAFYYDFRRTNAFAGRELINPQLLFSGFELVWGQRLGRFASVPMRDRVRGLMASGLGGDSKTASVREMVGDMLAPSHEALLLRKA
jgi:SAM-dependent methyltransferase